MTVALVWFRQDLRLADNPALALAIEATKGGGSIVPVFIDDPTDQTLSSVGAASRVWLHHSLITLSSDLEKRGAPLRLLQGSSLPVLQQLAKDTGASRLFWNRCYDPVTRTRDEQIKSTLTELSPVSANAALLFEPWESLKKDGTPYRVFTPLWRHLADRLADATGKPLSAPKKLSGWIGKLKGEKRSVHALKLLPSEPWHRSMMDGWSVGEKAASKTLDQFLSGPVRHYGKARDIPAEAGTSRMSPHLHFGEIGPRQIIHRLLGKRHGAAALERGEEVFAKEVVWREFAFSLLFHFPYTIEQPLDERFQRFPWREDAAAMDDLKAWQQGQTGIPIVDAGMRQLYATGWMHNRVRMVVASFLIKNLLLPWQLGERWFRDTLVDADLASNTMGWQWAAGSGADAAPFFRVFNPVLQGEKFDCEGAYVKRWVPELAEVERKFIHKPWELPSAQRSQLNYPVPRVDLKLTRQRALDAFQSLKR